MRARLLAPLVLLMAASFAACGAPTARPAAAFASSAASATSASTPLAATATATVEAATPTPGAPSTQGAPVRPPAVAPKDPPRVGAVPRAPGDRTRIVVLDPGHGEEEVGAAANGVVEKISNLDMAFRVEALLAQQGVRVVLTRRTDERAYAGTVTPVQGYSATRRDLQARIDLANDVGADLFVSLHSNGSASTGDRGVETYWNSQRPWAEQNRALASTIQATVVGEMASAGTPVLDRGAKDDSCLRGFQGRCFPLFVLGPGRTSTGQEVTQGGPPQIVTSSRPTLMPAALVELLFVSSPADAALLQSDGTRDTLARGVARGIVEYLNQNTARTG